MSKWAFPRFEIVAQAAPKETHEQCIEKISQDAFHEGFNKGYQEGYQEGVRKGKEKTDQQLLSLHRSIEEINKRKEEIVKKMEEACFLVLKKICKHVLHKELSESEEVILSIVRKSLELFDLNSEKMRLFCSRDLFLLLEEKKLDFTSTLIIEKDETLQDFDFILESQTQCVDFQFEKAMARLFNYAE